MHVAWVAVVPDAGDADLRLGHVLCRQPGGIEHGLRGALRDRLGDMSRHAVELAFGLPRRGRGAALRGLPVKFEGCQLTSYESDFAAAGVAPGASRCDTTQLTGAERAESLRTDARHGVFEASRRVLAGLRDASSTSPASSTCCGGFCSSLRWRDYLCGGADRPISLPRSTYEVIHTRHEDDIT